MRVIFGTGGTGGHLYPALALASYIKEQDPTSEFLFVGTPNHLEATVVPENGYAFKAMDVSGLSGSAFNKAKALLKFVKSIKKSNKIIKEFQPDLVMGFGGYVSASIVLAASKKNIPTMIHEQNSIVGLANKILIKHVDGIVTCYQKAMDELPENKTYLLGNPRATEVKEKPKVEILEQYGLDSLKPFVLIVMGSLGSSSVNNVILEALDEFKGKEYQVVFVTGKNQYEGVMKAYNKENKQVKIIPYVEDMPSMLSKCSLVVSRAGASTLAEITSLGVPSLIIPSPYVASNHQEFNARELYEKEAAEMILEKDLSAHCLVDKIDALMSNPTRRQRMQKQASDLGKPNASKDIYELMKKISRK